MKLKNIIGSVALALLAPAIVFGASDGSIDTTSTGTSTISLTIPKLIRVRNMNDFAFGTYAGTGSLDSNDDINISSNYSGTYRVTLTGSGAASAFTITDGTDTIAYTVAFNDATGTTGGVSVTSGTAVTAQSGVLKPLSTTTTNANIRVQMAESNIQAVDAGTYSGTLTILAAPE